MMMLRAMIAAFALLAAAPALARVPAIEPAAHGGFDHYTLALTWQPGFCAEGSCTDRTSQRTLIGLHGLWASLPDELADRGINNPQWWSRGCDYYHRIHAAPRLPDETRHVLDAIMPRTKGNLLRHEYDKHVQCFGFDTNGFFQTAIAMHDAVARSPFGQQLISHAGRQTSRAELIAAFDRDFATDRPRALQLQCHVDRDGSVVLSQLWITVRHDRIAEFPDSSSLMDSPVPQDNCPAQFGVPGWN